MTVMTLTLTDFILARIDEDEDRAGWHHRLLCMRTACDAEGCIWGAGEEDAIERERVCTCGYPARVLAEVAAKRRIVALHGARSFHGHQTVDDVERRRALDPVLRALASVYVDHPDFRAEWKSVP